MLKKLFILTLSSVAFVGLVQAETLAKAKESIVKIYDLSSRQVGELHLSETPQGVQLEGSFSQLSPGKHGIHIHESGQCLAPDFKSAGAHFNPHAKQHGLANPAGAHGGDMPNLEVDAQGNAKFSYLAKGLKLSSFEANSLSRPGGTSIVIHAKEDDQKTDPAGGSGDRIACGVVKVER